MHKFAKKALFFAFTWLGLCLMAAPALALMSKPPLAVNIPTVQLTNISVVSDQGGFQVIDIPWLSDYITGVYRYAATIATVLAGVMFMVGAFQYTTAGGDASRVSKAKERITDALIGMFLVLGAYVILATLSPDLTSLSALRVKTVKRITFVPNETPATPNTPGTTSTVPPGTVPTGGAAATGLNGVPFYGQCNSPNNSTPYLDIAGNCTSAPGSGRPYTICSSGCGVTSAAMVVAQYHPELRSHNLPGEVSQLSSRNGFRPCGGDCNCSGTSPGLFSSQAMRDTYNMTAETLRGRDAVMAQLQAGHPIIAAVRNGGHYVVITGVNDDGTLQINDPNSASAGHNYWGEDTTHVSADHVFSTTTGFWYMHPVGQ